MRHAEFAPELGLDTTHKLAFVGSADAADVLEFIERVTRIRGWQSRRFFNLDDGLDWLRSP